MVILILFIAYWQNNYIFGVTRTDMKEYILGSVRIASVTKKLKCNRLSLHGHVIKTTYES